MAGPVAGSYAVVVFGEDGSVCGDEHRAERLVARLQCLGRQFHAASQVPPLGFRWIERCGHKMLLVLIIPAATYRSRCASTMMERETRLSLSQVLSLSVASIWRR